jgi:uncharacterized phage-associated protein
MFVVCSIAIPAMACSQCVNGETQDVSEPPYDPRAVANLMLEEGQRTGRLLGHLVLQKLLYFAHGLFLVERKQPLVLGYFEAWQYGPVHPAIYQAFKASGDQPINFRAMRQNLVTGELCSIPLPSKPDVRNHVARVIAQYGGLTPGRLVDISHAKGAPWRFVVDRPGTTVALGLRITDVSCDIPALQLCAIACGSGRHCPGGYGLPAGDAARAVCAYCRIWAKCRKVEDYEPNLRVAQGLYDHVVVNKVLARKHDFHTLALGGSARLSFWHALLLIQGAEHGAPLVPFFNPRRSQLPRPAKAFVFSVMHERIRVADPDFSNVRLGIYQFTIPDKGPRKPVLSTDAGVTLFGFDELDQMVRETYEIWTDVYIRRREQERKRG